MKDVLEFNGSYKVDENGNVYSKTGRKLKCTENGKGYKQLFTYKDGKFYKAYLVHRLVWEAFNGKIEDGFVIDHINRNKSDNRLENLRIVTFVQNLWNQDVKGYSWFARANKWIARITVNGKRIHLGYFDLEDDARKAYVNAKKVYHTI